MAAAWRSRDLSLTLPEPVLRSMWQRARQRFGVHEGGCYDARSGTTLLLWSGPLVAARARPIGAITVRWPGGGCAEIARIAWTTDHAARESQVWRALEVLAGSDWPLIQRELASRANPSQLPLAG